MRYVSTEPYAESIYLLILGTSFFFTFLTKYIPDLLPDSISLTTDARNSTSPSNIWSLFRTSKKNQRNPIIMIANAATIITNRPIFFFVFTYTSILFTSLPTIILSSATPTCNTDCQNYDKHSLCFRLIINLQCCKMYTLSRIYKLH